MPMYPEAIDVIAPRTKERVVKNPVVISEPQAIKANKKTPKPMINWKQMEYSEYKKASAPLEIAS